MKLTNREPIGASPPTPGAPLTVPTHEAGTAEPMMIAADRAGSRAVAWDAFLSLALVAVTALPGVVRVGVAGLAVPGVRTPATGCVAVVLVVVGISLGVSVLRNWPSARDHYGAWLTFSGVMGNFGAFLTAMILAPWPDLLSYEVLWGGPWRFALEAGRTFVPWWVGALVAFAVLHYDPFGPGEKR